jgi:DNA-3-methyladenine glycosylase II
MTARALEHLAQADAILGTLIGRVGPCEWKPRARTSPFQSLVESVAHQQLNGTAAKTILGRFKALYPGRRFPSPADVLATPDEKMRAAGLSRAKVAAIRDIAAHTLTGIVPTSRIIAKMEDAVILEQLTAIRGVGP